MPIRIHTCSSLETTALRIQFKHNSCLGSPTLLDLLDFLNSSYYTHLGLPGSVSYFLPYQVDFHTHQQPASWHSTKLSLLFYHSLCELDIFYCVCGPPITVRSHQETEMTLVSVPMASTRHPCEGMLCSWESGSHLFGLSFLKTSDSHFH